MLKRFGLGGEKGKYDVEPSKTFIVRYIGKVERSTPGGENMDRCLKEFYEQHKDEEKSLPRVYLSISPQEIIIRETNNVNNEMVDVIVPMNRISYVAADRKHQLFAFSDHVSQRPRRVDCHAFLCNVSETSNTVVEALSNAFHESCNYTRRSAPRAQLRRSQVF